MQFTQCLSPLVALATATCLNVAAQLQLDDFLVTATAEPRSALTLPAAVTIIDRGEIEQSRALDVPELLRRVGGLDVTDTTGSRGRTTQIDMRGFGETGAANLAVVVDGRTLNLPTLAGVDWTTIPLARIERIEIVRGGGAVMYGDNATAGVINIITRRPGGDDKQPTSVSLESRAGRYSDWRHTATATGGDDRLSWHLDAGSSEFGGYRDNSDYTAGSVGGGIDVSLGDGMRLALDGGWKDDEYGLPGALTIGADPTTTVRPGDKADSNEFYVSATPEFTIGDNLLLRLPVHYRQADYASDYSGFPFNSRIRQLDVRPTVSFDLATGTLPHRMTVGLDYRRGELDQAVNSIPATRSEEAVWVQDTITLKPEVLFLDLGLRLGQVEYDYETLADSDDDLMAASAGLSWLYGKGSRAFASVQQGYRTQLLDELNYVFNPLTSTFDPVHPGLPTQTSVTWQLGVRHAFCDRFTAGVTAFLIDTDEEIFYDPSTFSNSTYGSTRRRGLELEIISRPADGLTLSGFLTLTDSELRDAAYNGNAVPGTTPLSARLQARWQPVERFFIEGRVRWSQDRTLISDWADSAPSWNDDFVVTDVTVSWQLSDLLTVYGGCNNLFNETYSEYGVAAAGADFTLGTADDEARVYPSPEREFFGGVRLTLSF